MSRSKQKNPISGITVAESEKKDKQSWHRRWRRKVKQMLSSADADELQEMVLPNEHDVSDPWSMDKDGKRWFGDAVCKEEVMRK